MNHHPPGFRIVWGTIGAAALALLLYQAQQHDASQGQPRAGAGPQQSAPATPSSTAATRAAAAPTTQGAAVLPVSDGRPRPAIAAAAGATSSPASPAAPTTPAPAPSGGGSPAPSGTPTTPSTPSTPAPLLGASLTVALPLRSASLEVRVGLVVGAAPPFPLLPGIEASIGLP